jgi:hypothetical protein
MGRGQQMDVDPANSRPIQPMTIHEGHCLVVFCDGYFRQNTKEREDLVTPTEGPARQFSHDKWMTLDLALVEQRGKPRVVAAEVIDPDRGVDEHQPRRSRRVGLRRRTDRA